MQVHAGRDEKTTDEKSVDEKLAGDNHNQNELDPDEAGIDASTDIEKIFPATINTTPSPEEPIGRLKPIKNYVGPGSYPPYMSRANKKRRGPDRDYQVVERWGVPYVKRTHE